MCLTFIVAAVIGTAPAYAAPDHKVGDTLGVLWQTVLETPTPQNPFAGGDPCLRLGSVLAPFTPLGTATVSCTVKPGTPVFITAESSECSTLEPPPFFGADESQLRACARAADAGFATPSITLDGARVPTLEVETGLLPFDLPGDNILGVPAQRGYSVAHGWAALLNPLVPGVHHVVIRVVGTDVFGNPVDLTNHTTIVVAPGR